MATKKLNLNELMEKWLKENLDKLSIEQVKQLRDNPAIMLDAMFEGVRKACEERGMDYTQTQVYQE